MPDAPSICGVTVRPVGRRLGSAWHAVTAVAVLVGLVWQLVLVIQGVNVLVEPSGALPAVSTRLIRFFRFFTGESNVLVVIVAATLAVRPARDGRCGGSCGCSPCSGSP